MTPMNDWRMPGSWLYPVAVWLGLLAAIFLAEYGVMLVLPWVLADRSSRAIEAIVDSVVLTCVVAPALWFTIVRPLTEIIRLRAQFLNDLFEHIETDRRQTARDLHDGVGQSLTLLISGLRSAKSCRENESCNGRVNDFLRLAEHALTEVRRLSMGLRPSLLDDLGLAAALEKLVEDIRPHTATQINLDVSGIVSAKLPDDVATAVFRIVQEALSNVVKHSQANHAIVTVRLESGQVAIEVGDDGRGIDPATLRATPAGHLGMRGIRERAALLEGELTIDSAPNKGTRIAALLPVKGNLS